MQRAVVVVVAVMSAACAKPTAPSGPPVTTQLMGKNHVVDLSGGPCAPGASCTVRAVVRASGGTHINTEYPHRFEPAKTSTLSYSELKAFVVDIETQGTLTTTFTAPASGEAIVEGNLRFSVCSADHCQIETVPLVLRLPTA